jgi:hypothetical protein
MPHLVTGVVEQIAVCEAVVGLGSLRPRNPRAWA